MFAVCLLIELSRTFTCSLPYDYHYPTHKVLDVCLRENRYHSQKEIIFRSVSLPCFVCTHGVYFLMPFSSEVALAPCRWTKLGLLIANQEARDPQACPYGYIATILRPSASLIPCSPRPAAARKTRQSDSSFIEGWRQRRFPIVLPGVENGLIDHKARKSVGMGQRFLG